MKKIQIALIFFLSVNFLNAQTDPITEAKLNLLFEHKQEIYFSFSDPGPSKLRQISQYLSLDHHPLRNGQVYAYANARSMRRFMEEGLPYQVLSSPGVSFQPLMKSIKDFNFQAKDLSSICSIDWNFFPTYDAYEALLQQFQHDFPQLCKIDTLAELASGRRILAAHLGDKLDEDEDEPEFLYTSTMHGDETTGYNLLLHLIAYLLCNYETDADITHLLNEVDIYINPLANPDGAYASNNSTVYGATRSNSQGYDLNRNFPDPDDGDLPGGTRQPEALAFMDYAAKRDFTISANLHGGAEVANYPWDTWSRRAADDAWWQYVCRNYANTAQANGPAGFFDDENNGITNGYDWYIISGGRQDYMNTFEYCREFTLELSNVKNLPGNTLEAYWGYHKDALLGYMAESLNGLRGTVVDSISQEALKAKVFIAGHDKDSSHVYSSLPIGNYHRYLSEATYSVTFSAEGYFPKTIDNVQIQNGMATRLAVELVPEVVAGLFDKKPHLKLDLYPNPATSKISVQIPDNLGETDLVVFDISGRIMLQKSLNFTKETDLDIGDLAKGIYLVKIVSPLGHGVRKFVKE